MLKGYVLYKDGHIPFVIDGFKMELFTDDPILTEFCHEHNNKDSYLLEGCCFTADSYHSQKLSICVEYSIGCTCELLYYLVENLFVEGTYTEIRFESHSLDAIFRYAYHFIDQARSGVNLAASTYDVYKIQFNANDNNYEMTYRIGFNEQLGLLEDHNRKGTIIIPLKDCNTSECFSLATIFQRLSSFMISQTNPAFNSISLYHAGRQIGKFYCRYLSNEVNIYNDFQFYELNVDKYIPMILNNIALDTGNEITRSIPLGHLSASGFPYSPQRFIEQITAFEYLFEKLDHDKAQSKSFPLTKELQLMFDSFPDILAQSKINAKEASNTIKELRRKIVHGYSYFYDFSTDRKKQYLIICLERLIKAMSLRLIGFNDDDIAEYLKEVPF